MPTETKPPLSVSQLMGLTKQLLEGALPQLWVSGEISNFVKATSGHMYLTLKDDSAQLRCAFFRGSNLRLRFDPKNGMQVLARGQIGVYPTKGDLQFIIEELQPQGVGAVEVELRKRKERLLAKGYFSPERKRRFNPYPTRVAIVASATGAALRDFLELFRQRWPQTIIIVRHSRVQGIGAAEEIAASIALLNDLHNRDELPLDAIVLARGGGSTEDLWAFNEEVVADAIYTSAVPIVSAIGHEIDVTIADLVADLRAETPSAAVMALTPDRQELLETVSQLQSRLQDAPRRLIELRRERLRQLLDRPAFTKPFERIRLAEQQLDATAARLDRAMRTQAERARLRTDSLAEQLHSLSPLQVLSRGYSLTQTYPGGVLIRSSDDLKIGDTIRTRFNRGSVVSEVRRVEPPEPTLVKDGTR